MGNDVVEFGGGFFANNGSVSGEQVMAIDNTLSPGAKSMFFAVDSFVVLGRLVAIGNTSDSATVLHTIGSTLSYVYNSFLMGNVARVRVGGITFADESIGQIMATTMVDNESLGSRAHQLFVRDDAMGVLIGTAIGRVGPAPGVSLPDCAYVTPPSGSGTPVVSAVESADMDASCVDTSMANVIGSGNLLGLVSLGLVPDPSGMGLWPAATSPLLDAAPSMPGFIADDISGTPRPQGVASDIGAMERPVGAPLP